MEFLDDPSIKAHDRYEVWQAVDARHELEFWDSNFNPVLMLRFWGVRVDEEGTVHVPPEIREALER